MAFFSTENSFLDECVEYFLSAVQRTPKEFLHLSLTWIVMVVGCPVFFDEIHELALPLGERVIIVAVLHCITSKMGLEITAL